MEKEARNYKKQRKRITPEICEHLQLLMAGGADATKAAGIIGISASRASMIKLSGFDYEVYREKCAEEHEKRQKKAAETPAEQLPGQVTMELTEDGSPVTVEKPAEEEQGSMMRFLAAMVDRIIRVEKGHNDTELILLSNINDRLDRLNNTLCQLIRAVRHE